ncbi:MAG: hypothetical protein A3D99_03110 [Candidatus Andersenbacteria bacterium RIFCSPHIGHO2_12_FULL_45_11]|uniref:citrate synthase (unknown stereospecificity) n=1 Tax=Candidatus Andersenbacteria bacterium RIFCSPHIGHO2_12_FULL_45_11 TaxID=1797281 RepID=A0A1G1WZV2_9BACT|nr:MAG: hypothetical protein A3D99_03110 [Candidatus Andersenbacteria bacterium RIFCSPHIGHO2_12_FULL_45_11]
MPSLTIESNISSNKDGEHFIRGKSLSSLVKRATVADMIMLLWRGKLPTKDQRALLDTILVAMVEHGVESPSTFVPRISASTGNAMNAALATSALVVGTKHGGAIEAAAHLLSQKESAAEIVTEYLAQKKILPGYGHRIYKEEDPRATLIFKRAKQLKFKCTYFKKAYNMQGELKKQKGIQLPLNIDGAAAAAMLELGIDPAYGMALFIIPRMIGAAAHIVEEQQTQKGYRRLK